MLISRHHVELTNHLQLAKAAIEVEVSTVFSRQQFWHTSVSMVRLHSICNRTVSRRQRVLVVVTCVLLRRDSWSFPERGRNTATAASPFKDFVSGTVFLLSLELQTFQ